MLFPKQTKKGKIFLSSLNDCDITLFFAPSSLSFIDNKII